MAFRQVIVAVDSNEAWDSPYAFHWLWYDWIVNSRDKSMNSERPWFYSSICRCVPNYLRFSLARCRHWTCWYQRDKTLIHYPFSSNTFRNIRHSTSVLRDFVQKSEIHIWNTTEMWLHKMQGRSTIRLFILMIWYWPPIREISKDRADQSFTLAREQLIDDVGRSLCGSRPPNRHWPNS
jgi:hypothetical protein